MNEKLDALVMLYLQNQDLSDKSPSEIFDIYIRAREEIKQHAKAIKKPDDYVTVTRG